MKTSLCLLLASAFDAAKAAPVSAGEVRPPHTRSHPPAPLVCSPKSKRLAGARPPPALAVDGNSPPSVLRESRRDAR